MKFKEVLNEKGISINELPKMVQKKIEQIESISSRVEEHKKNAIADETDDIKLIESQIRDLDDSLVKSLNKFDPEKYKKRIQHLSKINKRVKIEDYNLKETKSDNNKEDDAKQEEILVEKEEEKKEDISEENLNNIDKNSKEEIKVDINKANDIKKKLKGLKESLEIKNIKETIQEESKNESEVEEVEVEELKNNGDANPKKSLSLILIGVGAFLITWGAVNYFKNRNK
jgi:hypothetical protein